MGLCLPLGLALAVYLTSARSLAAPPPIGAVPTQIAKASPKAPTTTANAREREDRSGNCDEAEHASDPECNGGTTTSDGGSSGSDDSSGSGSSELRRFLGLRILWLVRFGIRRLRIRFERQRLG